MNESETFHTPNQSQTEVNLKSSFYHQSKSANLKAESTFKEKEIQNKYSDLEKKF